MSAARNIVPIAGKPRVSIVSVDPATAERWLQKNIANNRAKKQNKIAAYVRDMRNGEWHLNGESIKFDTNGNLIDGQNRLTAVVESGCTVAFVVVHGVQPAALGTIDVGSGRSYADTLKIEGRDNGKTLAAVVRRAVMWESGNRINSGKGTPSPSEMDAFLNDHPEIEFSALLASSLRSRSLLPASVIGLCHYLFARYDADQAYWFLERVADGDSLAATHPVAALRERLLRMRLSGGRIHETEALALVIKAWNACRAGESRSKLQLPPGGLTAANFPAPH